MRTSAFSALARVGCHQAGQTGALKADLLTIEADYLSAGIGLRSLARSVQLPPQSSLRGPHWSPSHCLFARTQFVRRPLVNFDCASRAILAPAFSTGGENRTVTPMQAAM